DLDRFALAKIIPERNLLVADLNQVPLLEPMMQQFACCIGRTGIIIVSPSFEKRPQILSNGNRRYAATGDDSSRLTFRICSYAMSVRLFVRREERFECRDVDVRLVHTFTSTVMLVSHPNTSTTFTQATYFPGFGYFLNPASLVVFRLRSFRVR